MQAQLLFLIEDKREAEKGETDGMGRRTLSRSLALESELESRYGVREIESKLLSA